MKDTEREGVREKREREREGFKCPELFGFRCGSDSQNSAIVLSTAIEVSQLLLEIEVRLIPIKGSLILPYTALLTTLIIMVHYDTVELQWLEHLWDHAKKRVPDRGSSSQ